MGLGPGGAGSTGGQANDGGAGPGGMNDADRGGDTATPGIQDIIDQTAARDSQAAAAAKAKEEQAFVDMINKALDTVKIDFSDVLSGKYSLKDYFARKAEIAKSQITRNPAQSVALAASLASPIPGTTYALNSLFDFFNEMAQKDQAKKDMQEAIDYENFGPSIDVGRHAIQDPKALGEVPDKSNFDGPDQDDTWRPVEGGLVNQLFAYGRNPTYANAPKFDPTTAFNAFNAAMGGVNTVVDERGFTGKGYAQSARDKIQTIFDTLTPESDPNALLNEMLGKQYANTALTETENRFRTGGVESVNQLYGDDLRGQLFSPEFSTKAYDDIIARREQAARSQVGNAFARGNLNQQGFDIGNQQIEQQREPARARIGELGEGLIGNRLSTFDTNRNKALSSAKGFTLGDELFDIGPTQKQFETNKEQFTTNFGRDVENTLGQERLFNPTTALQKAGAGQGLVSGQAAGGNTSLLDTLASQKGDVRDYRSRTLGTRGSGAF